MTKTDTPDSGFLGRWSRRKLEGQPAELVEQTPGDALLSEVDAEPELASEQQSADTVMELSAVDPEERLLTDEDMPPIESLDADSDYSPFFSEGVSKQLRNMALKRLFFSGKFAIRDGLDDYDDDFTKFEPLGDTITSDMKFHQRRKEKARLAKLEEERLEEERREEEEKAAQLAANDESATEQSVNDKELENSEVSIESAGSGKDESTAAAYSVDQSLEQRDNVADNLSPTELAAKTASLMQDDLSPDNPPERRSKLTSNSAPEAMENAQETTRIENEKRDLS